MQKEGGDVCRCATEKQLTSLTIRMGSIESVLMRLEEKILRIEAASFYSKEPRVASTEKSEDQEVAESMEETKLTHSFKRRKMSEKRKHSL